MGFGSRRFRLSGICLWTVLGGVGIFAADVTGEGAEREWGLESERRGSTAASVSWFTSADMSMVGDGRVVLRFRESCGTYFVLQPFT